MHIETELDDTYTERLLQLQQHLNKPLPDVVAHILQQALDTPNSEQSFGQRSSAHTSEQREALAYLDSIKIDWGGKPIPNRDALYDNARS